MLASFAPTIVGLLAEQIFGYKIGDGMRSDDPKVNKENAASLAKSLYTAVAIPMALCCSIYSFLYCTYPRDRNRVKIYSQIVSEIQDMELASSDVVTNYSQIQNFEPEYNDKTSTVCSPDCCAEEKFENDMTAVILLGANIHSRHS
jgi:hypothetical protein